MKVQNANENTARLNVIFFNYTFFTSALTSNTLACRFLACIYECVGVGSKDQKERDSLNAFLVRMNNKPAEEKKKSSWKIKYGKNSAYLIRLEIFWHETVVLFLQGFRTKKKTKGTFTLEKLSAREKETESAKTFGTFCMTFNENENFSSEQLSSKFLLDTKTEQKQQQKLPKVN